MHYSGQREHLPSRFINCFLPRRLGGSSSRPDREWWTCYRSLASFPICTVSNSKSLKPDSLLRPYAQRGVSGTHCVGNIVSFVLIGFHVYGYFDVDARVNDATIAQLDTY